MRLVVDTTDPRWSPTQRLVLEQVKDKLQQEPRKPTDAAIVQALDEALGEPDGPRR
jgi:hypothetical protein